MYNVHTVHWCMYMRHKADTIWYTMYIIFYSVMYMYMHMLTIYMYIYNVRTYINYVCLITTFCSWARVYRTAHMYIRTHNVATMENTCIFGQKTYMYMSLFFLCLFVATAMYTCIYTCNFSCTYTKCFPADCNGIQHTSTAVTGSGGAHLCSICMYLYVHVQYMRYIGIDSGHL